MHSKAFPAFANHFYGITSSLACMFYEREDSSRYILHEILGEEVPACTVHITTFHSMAKGD